MRHSCHLTKGYIFLHHRCREAFDRLTEYSSLLLQHGDYNIHGTRREQVAAETDAAEAAQLQAVMGVLTTACTSTASQDSSQTNALESTSGAVDIPGQGQWRVDATAERAVPDDGAGAMPSMSARGDVDGMDVDVPSVAELAGSDPAAAAAAAAAAEQTVPADPDEDIFGGPQEAANEAAADTGQQSAIQIATASVPTSALTSHTQQAEATSARHPFTHGAELSDTQDIGSGFLYDETSGTWYNADLGYYYDASQGLYGDASSGQWYSYKDGTYQLVC